MRIALIFLLLSCRMWAGYSAYRPVVIDHTQVAANETNFTVAICANGASGTNCDSGAHSNLDIPNLKTVGNGGLVTSSSGYDVGFFSDACITSLNYELHYQSYIPTTGSGQWSIKIASLSSSVDTTIYICYGNAAITTNQSTTAAWDSNYKVMYHFSGDASGTTVSYNDSTSNGRNGTENSAPGPTELILPVNGKVGIAGQPNVTGSGQWIYATDTGLPAGSASRTISFWGEALVPDTNLRWWAGYGTWSAGLAQGLAIGSITSQHAIYSGFGAPTDIDCGLATNGTVYHFVLTYNSGTGTSTCYVNGSSAASGSRTINTTLAGSTGLHVWLGDPGNGNYAVMIDEFAIADVDRGANWITTTYNNQNSPWTFYTFGAEVLLAGTAPHRVISQ